jgi:hypothetical protein
MSGGSQCNVLHCVLRRHLYVDLQLCVSTIYWTARMNTDRTKCYYIVDKYCMKHVHVYNMANPKLISYEDRQLNILKDICLCDS